MSEDASLSGGTVAEFPSYESFPFKISNQVFPAGAEKLRTEAVSGVSTEDLWVVVLFFFLQNEKPIKMLSSSTSHFANFKTLEYLRLCDFLLGKLEQAT